MGSFENQVRKFVDAVEAFQKTVEAFQSAVDDIPHVIKVETPKEDK